MFYTIKWTDDGISMIDQRLLPSVEVYHLYKSYTEVAEAITEMVIRGAPAIGVAAAMGIALGVKNLDERISKDKLEREFLKICEDFSKTRPTAVNLFWAIDRMKRKFYELLKSDIEIDDIKKKLVKEALKIHEEDVFSNKKMGQIGQLLIRNNWTILTHCNAGALATGGYGTAVGVIRAAWEYSKKIRVFVDETRPYLQGARLTAWELVKLGIPATLITDNMAGHFMKSGEIDCVIVGADRIATNGDVANKIGTYGLSVLAKENMIPFFVAAPVSTIDFNIKCGYEIPIENRNRREVTHIKNIQIAPDGVNVENPAFDVTPNGNVSAIITEKGILRPPYELSIGGLKK